jgi:VWFA-related protein
VRRTLAFLVFLPLALAQSPHPADTPTLRARTSLVIVPVTVLDHHGDAVDGLGPADFTLASDGVPQRFHLDTTDTIDAPISLAVAVQTSGNSAAALVKIRKIASMLAPMLGGDRARLAVLSYSDQVTLLQPFTSNETSIDNAFARLKPGPPLSGTMLDAVNQAIPLLAAETGRRRVLLLIGESRDRGSKVKVEDLLPAIERSAIEVYALTYSAYATAFASRPSDLQPPEGGGLLSVFTELGRLAKTNTAEALVQAGGGERFSFVTRGSLERLVTRLSDHIHSQYLLSFTPTANTPDGLHQLAVDLPNHPHFTLHARPAYFWSGD